MKAFYKFCLILFLGSSLVSCSDRFGEDIKNQQVTDNSQLNAAGVLERMETPVFFHVVERDIVTNEQKGWIIDVQGKVRTYDAASLGYKPNLPKGTGCSSTQTETLSDLATTEKTTIDLHSLLNKVQKIRFAEKGTITPLVTDNNTTKSYEFYGLQKIVDQTSNDDGGCGGGSHQSIPSATSFELILLQTEGVYQQTNESAAAVSLVEWLKELENDVIL